MLCHYSSDIRNLYFSTHYIMTFFNDKIEMIQTYVGIIQINMWKGGYIFHRRRINLTRIIISDTVAIISIKCDNTKN